jgi:hypothetical protein
MTIRDTSPDFLPIASQVAAMAVHLDPCDAHPQVRLVRLVRSVSRLG